MISPSSLFAAMKMPTFLSGRSATVGLRAEHGAVVPDDLGAAIIRNVPAQSVEVEHAAGSRQIPAGSARIGVITTPVPHLRRLLLARRAVCRCRESSVAELRQEPAAHVVGADRKPARRRRILGDGRILVERRLAPSAVDRAVAAAVRPGVVGIGLELGVGVGRMVHSKRPEDVIVNVPLPSLAADFLDQLAGGHVEDVVVGVAAAEAGRGFK